MPSSWVDAQRAFADAAEWYVATVGRVDGRWDEPGLGEWDVRSLVGHTSRSFVTVESYLARPATEVVVETTGDYYRAIAHLSAGPEVTQRGVDAGVALGDDPVAAVCELADRVLALVATHDGTELLTTIAGGMRLADYLPTRTFELTVHTGDLALALGEPVQPPRVPAAQALDLVCELALDSDRAGELLLLATGRTGVPPGWSVL